MGQPTVVSIDRWSLYAGGFSVQYSLSVAGSCP